MNRFSTLPRVSQSLISRCAYVTGDEGIHGFGCDISSCLPCAGDLRDLSIKNTLFELINLESSQNVNLLD
jgi:hypothetical protein